MVKLKLLDLCSGIGGFSLGLERTGGFETIAFCEIDDFCQKVLKKHWPDVPVYDDIKNLRGDEFGAVNVISAGFPCQPYSTAGKRGGAEDNRAIWPEVSRVVRTVKPDWFIGENVVGIVAMGVDQVLLDLENMGYRTEIFIIPACAVDAPHLRDRVWIVADADRDGCDPRKPGNGGSEKSQGREYRDQSNRRRGVLADADRGGFAGSGSEPEQQDARPGSETFGRWAVEPGLGRMATRVPDRVDRLKSLGNAVVPAVVEKIGNAILDVERGKVRC